MYKNAINELQVILSHINNKLFQDKVGAVAKILAKAFNDGNKLLFIGNGGSAAEAQHMAAEYCATLSSSNYRRGYPAIALTTDTSFLTAWSNDFGILNVFSRQIETLGIKGDILFAYSTSGKSKNILSAIEVAKAKGLIVVGFTGGDGGSFFANVDHCFIIPSSSTARIQECHTFLGHEICAAVERCLGHTK